MTAAGIELARLELGELAALELGRRLELGAAGRCLELARLELAAAGAVRPPGRRLGAAGRKLAPPADRAAWANLGGRRRFQAPRRRGRRELAAGRRLQAYTSRHTRARIELGRLELGSRGELAELGNLGAAGSRRLECFPC